MREDFDTLPTLEESLGSLTEPKRSSAWVYCPDEDDTTTSLYPMGIELPNDYPDGGRKLPVRHASFAMPRYAKVHQRPQRSHSFAQQRDLNIERILKGSLRGPLPVGLPKLPRPKLIVTPRGHYAKPNRPVMRSNSMQITKSEKAEGSEPTLSTKFHACSLDELDSSSVLEVGSLASGKSSEHSLVDALTDIPSRSINSMQSAGFAAYTNNQTNEAIARANRYSAHSFSSPTLHSMETLEKSADSSSPLPTRFILPEPDYARPNSLRINSNHLGKINQDYHFKTSSQNHDKLRSSDADGKLFENSELSSFHPSVRSLGRSGKPKAPAPIPPYTFIPRVSPVKSTHLNHQQNGTSEFRSNTSQTNSTVSNDFNRANYHNPIYNNVESIKPSSTHERPSPVGKFSAGRHLETRITHFESNPLPVIEEVDRLSSEDYATVHKPRDEDYLHINDSVRPVTLQKPAVPTTPKPKSINVTKNNGIVKPPRNSVLQKKMLNNQGCNDSVVGEGRKHAGDIKRLENVLTAILDGEADNTREYYPQEIHHEMSNNTNKDVTRFPSQYEVVHREVLDDTEQLLGRIPSGEIKRNKIVLRVPSFRTAGCQTESYKPVRRRASCAQTNLSVAPRNKDASAGSYRTIATGPSRWVNPGNHSSPSAQPETSSSSSGYSSPEVSSKDPSPSHSGPPSPAAKVPSPNDRPRRSKSNVTVIEINKSGNTTLISTIEAPPPPRPPKPVRLRHSAAADLEGGGLLLPIHRKPKLTSTFQDVFGFSTLTENIITLTEAVNPVMIHPSRSHQAKSITSNQTISFNRTNTITNTPRIVDMHPKRISNHDEPISRAEVFAEDGRTSVLPRLRGVAFGSSSDLSQSPLNIAPSPKFERSDSVGQNRWTDELDWAAGQRWREERERELASRWSSDTGGRATAAYLASLELLASHYRHQALVNAKQLQRQKELLEQQKAQQQPSEEAEDRGSLSSTESEGIPLQNRQHNERFVKDTGAEWRNSVEQLRHQAADERGVWHT